MEKEALIDIILNDIKEVHSLVNTFKGKHELNAAFINLTRTKIANINEELTLLEQLNTAQPSVSVSESSLTSEKTAALTNDDNNAIAESSKRFAEGESTFDAPTEKHQSKTIKEISDDSELSPNHSETVPKASELSPRNVETSPNDSAISPNDSEASPNDSETLPKASKVSPRNVETSPNDSAISPNDSEASPSNSETSPNASEVSPKCVETSPNDSKVSLSHSDTAHTTKSKPSILGESIKTNSSSVNEVIANRKEQVDDIKQIGKPVDDVRKAFGLNDRFYYQRELFANNADLFNQTLDQINAMDSYDSARSFLQTNYNWSEDNEASETFYKCIRRRFI